MVLVANKRAESRCRYYVRDEARRLGWDVRHPNAGGSFLEEQELVDYFPVLKATLGDERPDFGALGNDSQLRLVIECKNDVNRLDASIFEACEYADKINNAKHFDVRVAVGVAGTPDRFVQTRGFFLRRNKWIDLKSHGWPLTQLPTLREIDIAIANADGTTDVQIPNEVEFAEAAVAINNILRLAKIEESVRPRVLGALILALYQGEFPFARDTVLGHINANIDAAIREFTDIAPDRRQFLKQTLTLSSESTPLRDWIAPIVHQLERLNVRSIVRSGVDFLGKFYEAFLRYGSDAKKMGIVFTPRHITRFAADITDVRLGMTVYDPAAGTGGFLVSAFDRMMQEATTEKAKAKVRQSLAGCDTNPTVWALAVLNMFFRGDGKSNMKYISCFEDADSVAGQFDRVLMNPPFSQEGEPETDFIDHALASLKPGGQLAVVVKTNVLVDDDLSKWRKTLVANHQVLGVISLPLDLFYPTAAPTVLMIVKAHAPSADAPTFLSRMENDGYEISKKRRIGRDGSQLPDILAMFNKCRKDNRLATVPNVACAVSRSEIANGDEICAERWLPSKTFGIIEFERYRLEAMRLMSSAVANYPDVVDELVDNYEELLSSVSVSGERPAERACLGKWFGIQAAASVGYTNYPGGTIPFVSSGDLNNSIVEFVQPPDDEIYDTPKITVTGFGQACVQPWRFCARGNGGSAVRILTPLYPMTLAELLWFVGQINSQRWRFNYGRMAIVSRLRRLEVDRPPGDLPPVTRLAQRIREFRVGLKALSEGSDSESEPLESRFNRLAAEWKAGRGPHSTIAKMVIHPAYQQIIGMGNAAIPLLLKELEQRPGHWAWALRAITGENPVPVSSRGKLIETAKAWVKWGRDKGYQW